MKILVIESDLRIQSMLKTMINAAFNAEVLIVKNEMEILTVLFHNKLDITIIGSSINFPSTKDLVYLIRSSEASSNAPIIKINASLIKSELMEYIKLGINDFLLIDKFNFVSFIQKINSLLKDSITMVPVKKSEHANFLVENNASLEQKQTNSFPDELNNLKLLLPTNIFEKKLLRIAGIHPLPYIITELLNLTSSLDTDINNLVKLVETDFALTAKVLKLANSAFYKRGQTRIFNLKEAIKIVGCAGVKDLALAANIIPSINKENEEQLFLKIKLWYYSLTIGVIAKNIAVDARLQIPESSFVIGLLKPIGLAILEEHFPKEFSKILEVSKEYNLPLAKVSKKLIGFTTNEISSKILALWGYPKNIYEPILYSDLSFEEIIDKHVLNKPLFKDIITIKIAEALAKSVSGGYSLYENIDEIPIDIIDEDYLDIPEESIIKCTLDIKDTVNELAQILLLHISPETLQQCDEFNKFKTKKIKKCVLITDNYLCISIFTLIFKHLNIKIKIVKNKMFEENIIKRENPEIVLIDLIDEYNTNYTPDSINNLIENTNTTNKQVLYAISAPDSTINNYKEKLRNHLGIFFLPKPFITSNIYSLLQEILNLNT